MPRNSIQIKLQLILKYWRPSGLTHFQYSNEFSSKIFNNSSAGGKKRSIPSLAQGVAKILE
jgi:hypothetical protein